MAESTWLSLRIDVAGLPLPATKAIFQYMVDGLRGNWIFPCEGGWSWALDTLPRLCTTCASMDPDRLYNAYCEVESHQLGLINMFMLFDSAEFHITDADLREVHRGAVGRQLWIPPGIGPSVHPDQYAGVYASDQDWVPERRRRSPQIASQVKKWCTDLETEIHERELVKKIDPFHLAAKYSLSLHCISPFAIANGRMARMVAMAIIRRYTGGGVISLGSVPEAVSMCSYFMDSAFFDRGPESFARYLFSRTLESTQRAYTEYGKILWDDVERRQEAEIADIDWQELVAVVNAGPLLQHQRSQDITHQLNDQRDPIKHPWTVSGETCTMYEKAVVFLRDVQDRIDIREEGESSDEEMASDSEETSSSAEEDKPLTSTLGASSAIGSQTSHEGDEDKIMEPGGSDEEAFTETPLKRQTLNTRKRNRQNQGSGPEWGRGEPKRRKM
jgi:hypothetical protein